MFTMLRRIIYKKFVLFFYFLLFEFIYRGDYWRIYISYHKNKKLWKKLIWNKYMDRHSASISIDAKIASNLILPHGVNGIYITQSAEIGRNVVVFQQVTIGSNTICSSRGYGAPVIKDNVYIGAGAKIIGSVIIENNVRIGANAVVVKSVPYNSLVICSETRIIEKKEILDNRFQPYL